MLVPQFLIRSSSNLNLQIIRTGINAILDAFEFGSNQIFHFGILAPEKKSCGHNGAFLFDIIFVKLADNEDRHKISDEFECGSDLFINFRVTCPWAAKLFPILIMENNIAFSFHWIFVELADNPRRHKISHKFELVPD